MNKNNYEIDMCSGPIMRKLISFFVPLMISSILQLLFNAVDTIVVGRFSGNEALAAVGSTSALIALLTNFFIGISLGTNVLSARFFASDKHEELSEVVHTSITIAAISGIVIMFVGLFLSRFCLVLMGSPAEVIDQSDLYMRIYFCGMPFFMLYNYGAAILRAIGDTKRPLYFLIFAGVINALLNLFLVIVFHMGVAGVGIATVASQLISCVLVIRVLLKSSGSYQIILSRLHINRMYLSKIMQIGVPAGLQSTVINFSNVLLQSSVNSFGAIAMAGYTAANNMLGFCYQSVNAITQACMSFTSQNLGAGKYKRINRVLADCLILEFIVGSGMGISLYLLSPQLTRIYTTDPQVISNSVEILTITATLYALCGFMDMFPGAMRGMGYSAMPMILSVIGTVGMRIVWIFGVFPHHRSLFWLFISYPASWTVTIILQVICYCFVHKKVFPSVLTTG